MRCEGIYYSWSDILKASNVIDTTSGKLEETNEARFQGNNECTSLGCSWFLNIWKVIGIRSAGSSTVLHAIANKDQDCLLTYLLIKPPKAKQHHPWLILYGENLLIDARLKQPRSSKFGTVLFSVSRAYLNWNGVWSIIFLPGHNPPPTNTDKEMWRSPSQSTAMDKSEEKNVTSNVRDILMEKTHLRKCSGLLSSDEDLINTTLTNSHNIATPASILIIVFVFLFMRIRAITATCEAESFMMPRW